VRKGVGKEEKMRRRKMEGGGKGQGGWKGQARR